MVFQFDDFCSAGDGEWVGEEGVYSNFVGLETRLSAAIMYAFDFFHF